MSISRGGRGKSMQKLPPRFSECFKEKNANNIQQLSPVSPTMAMSMMAMPTTGLTTTATKSNLGSRTG